MGLLVPEATLPMGITVSNVYISLSGETINVQPIIKGNLYIVYSNYKIYRDVTRQPDTNIRIGISVETSNINSGIYTILYDKIKTLYPGSTDVIDPEVVIVTETRLPNGMTESDYIYWTELINNTSLYMSDNPGNTELEHAYNAAENSFFVVKSADITNLQTLKTLYNALIPAL
jgi:hypothetical protein